MGVIESGAGDKTLAQQARAALAAAFPETTFDALICERIGEAYGFASHLLRYRWNDAAMRRSAVVKLWETGSKTDLLELRFYETFVDVGIRIPRYLYGAWDESMSLAVLVLEDVSSAQQGDVLQPLDAARALTVARGLARMHASWAERPCLSELPWLTNAAVWTRDNDWFRSRRETFLARFGERLEGLPRALLMQIESAPHVANARLAEAQATLLHGDLHLDNFLFAEENEPVLLDWSRPLRGPAALNVADLLFEMIPLTLFDEVLDRYLQTFRQQSTQGVDREAFEKQLGGALLRKFALATCGVARWQPDSARMAEIIDAGIEWASRAVIFWQGRDPQLFSFLR